tara:strand:+ start:62 stop:448 length:387 start_codon:yes stop_codon:yes gene_type:complete
LEGYADSGDNFSFGLEGDDGVPILRGELRNVEGDGIPCDINISERISNQNGQLVFGIFTLSQLLGNICLHATFRIRTPEMGWYHGWTTVVDAEWAGKGSTICCDDVQGCNINSLSFSTLQFALKLLSA